MTTRLEQTLSDAADTVTSAPTQRWSGAAVKAADRRRRRRAAGAAVTLAALAVLAVPLAARIPGQSPQEAAAPSSVVLDAATGASLEVPAGWVVDRTPPASVCAAQPRHVYIDPTPRASGEPELVPTPSAGTACGPDAGQGPFLWVARDPSVLVGGTLTQLPGGTYGFVSVYPTRSYALGDPNPATPLEDIAPLVALTGLGGLQVYAQAATPDLLPLLSRVTFPPAQPGPLLDPAGASSQQMYVTTSDGRTSSTTDAAGIARIRALLAALEPADPAVRPSCVGSWKDLVTAMLALPQDTDLPAAEARSAAGRKALPRDVRFDVLSQVWIGTAACPYVFSNEGRIANLPPDADLSAQIVSALPQPAAGDTTR